MHNNPPEPDTRPTAGSYSRILKSSAIIGGAQGINMLVGMVRVKFVALLIGPHGVGLLATYQAAISLIATIAGLGIQTSAVREVADAVSVNDQERIGRTVLTLRRICWLTGSAGSLAVVVLARTLSRMTFNSTEHSVAIAMLGLTILMNNIQGGQAALIQGMRRIGDLAKLNVIGTVAGSAISVALYAWLGLQGIVPSLIAYSFLQLLAFWWFARRIEVLQVEMTWYESFRAAGGMVRLGVAFMWTGLVGAAVAYTTRALIVREIDLVAVGLFTAAFNLSGMMIGFILSAMGADYYPSLTDVASEHEKMCRLVNEQTEIGLLLSIPGLMATLTLAPWIIKIFYSVEFSQAVVLLQWFALGCLGRVISWPLGFVILAKGEARLFAMLETFANILHIGLIWGLLLFANIEGVGIAFLLLYVIHTFVVLAVCRRLINFTWSVGASKLLILTLPLAVGTFLLTRYLSTITATIAGLMVTMSTSIYCLRELILRLGDQHKISRIVLNIPILRCVIGQSME